MKKTGKAAASRVSVVRETPNILEEQIGTKEETYEDVGRRLIVFYRKNAKHS